MRLGIGVCATTVGLFAASAAFAQMDLPDATPPKPAEVFLQQCGTCHSLNPEELRQGPTLAHVYGRKAGSVPGFKYSDGFAKADFVWDEQHLDAYLTNPQAVISTSVMPYRQADEAVRKTIIGYLKEQH